jgi:hypothetical protein
MPYKTEGGDPRPFVNHYIHYLILWARYAGNNIDADSPDDTTPEILDRQISYFLEQDLPELEIPYTSPHNGALPPLKVFITQKKTDFVLWGLRSTITSLQYNDSHAAHFSYLAFFTVNQMATFAQDIRRPFSLRHRMTSSLSNALLVLCSLLLRNVAGRDQAHIDAFRRAMAMLQDLASSQIYAKRVLSDFENIVRVVEEAIDGKVVPDNVAELFPYKSPSAGTSTRVERPRTVDNGNGTGESKCGVLWL